MKAAACLAAALLAPLAAAPSASPAAARTLTAGEGKEFALPSEAIAAAKDGDTVLIAPGEYFDCAIVRANDLTIAGDGPGAAMTDKACEEKALLVIRTDRVTVRDLTLKRARVPDGNGAGIRLEGPNLTISRVLFDNDQVGLLSGSGGGHIRIEDSRFERGGASSKFAVMVGRSALLTIANATFTDVKGGQVISAADRTQITGSTIQTGGGDPAPDEPPASAVQVTEGALLLENDTLIVGPHAPPNRAAISLWDDATAVLRNNRLENRTKDPIILLQDWTWGHPVLDGNTIPQGDDKVTSSGVWRHRAALQYYARKADAHALASAAKQTIKRLLGR